MISQRKLEANRRNAQKSTGPKTEEGKKKVRLNALTHGLTAQTVVLPHEDAEAYQQRLDDWTADLQPRTKMERYLVERAVRVSWQLDRADFHERARLVRRIEQLRRERAKTGGGPARALVKQLLAIPKETEVYQIPSENDPPRVQPAHLVAQLEATAAGCQALLDEWFGLWNFLAGEKDKTTPRLPDQQMVGDGRVVRLLGYRDPEAKIMTTVDRRIAALLETQELAFDNFGQNMLYLKWDDEDEGDENQVAGTPPRKYEPPPGPDPEHVARLNEELWLLADENYRHLQTLLAERQAVEVVEVDPDEEAAFDDTPEGERLHRYQTQWSRTFRRTLDEIHRQREQRDLAPAPSPAEVNPPNQTHRSVQRLSPERTCGEPTLPGKATAYEAIQPFTACPAIQPTTKDTKNTKERRRERKQANSLGRFMNSW